MMNNGIALRPSSIVATQRLIEQKETYKNHIIQFLEKYDTDNIIIKYDGQNIFEAVSGYFVVENTYNTLKDALKNLLPEHSIQILGLENENRVYRLGYIYQGLNECKHAEKVINIKTLQDIL